MASIPQTRQFVPLRIAILTVSDTRTLADDISGGVLRDLIALSGHTVAFHALATDDVEAIRRTVSAWLDARDIDVILTTGGTGMTGRDVTPEALKPFFDKEIDGFSALFHMISFAKIGTSTIQSRACAGLAKGVYIFCLPGSPGACRDAWDGILKPQLDIRHRPCNFVEVMPRLLERRGPQAL